MRSAIFGSGSLGTILGAYITKAGFPVDLFSRNTEHVKLLNERGAQISGHDNFTQKVSAFLPSEMVGEYDIIILMTKQLQNEETLPFLKEHLKKGGLLCTVQNGIPELKISSVVGKERTVGCTIGWGATMTEPGSCTLTTDSEANVFTLVYLDRKILARLKPLEELLSAMGKVIISDNFLGTRWSKLLINASFTGIGTVAGLTFGGVCDNKKARLCAQRVMKECIEVAHAQGIVLEKVQGHNIEQLFSYKTSLKQKISYFLIPLAMKKHRDIIPGMLCDINNGKLSEIDFVVGLVSAQGRENNVSTPFCDLTVKLVHEIEDPTNPRKPSIANLEEYK